MGVNLPWVYVHSAIYETDFGVRVFQRCILNWRGGVNLPWVYVHSAVYDSYLVYRFSRDLCLIGGGGEVNLPWVYVHSAIYDSYSV